MKSKWIVLSLLATSGLFAEDSDIATDSSLISADGSFSRRHEKNAQDQQTYYQAAPAKTSEGEYCGSCEPCCKPCCVPQPRQCVNCECYTPRFNILQCDWGMFVTAEFLYWYARETNLAYALKVQGAYENSAAPSSSAIVFAPVKSEHLNTKWDPGFRIGVGFNGCDGWDYYFDWTWYHNKKSSSTSVPSFVGTDPFLPGVGQSILVNSWVNPSFTPSDSGSTADLISFNQVEGKWRFYLNQIDFQLGRKYWLSRCFNMRTYAGVRGAWTKTKFHTESLNTNSTSTVTYNYFFDDKFTNRYWGVGLLAGFQPMWYLWSNFGVFADLDGSLIYGQFKANKNENYSGIQTTSGVAGTVISYSDKLRDTFYQMQPILDLALGLRWEEYWCCDRYYSALDVGWEHHVWFDHNHRVKTSDAFVNTSGNHTGGFRSFAEAEGNLGFGGLVIRLRLDF